MITLRIEGTKQSPRVNILMTCEEAWWLKQLVLSALLNQIPSVQATQNGIRFIESIGSILDKFEPTDETTRRCE
jgi:hypothetical protein